MIKIENKEVVGWEHAIRGMRNPKNSWEKSDSEWYPIGIPTTNPAAINDKYLSQKYCLGYNDLDLMTRLRNAGTDHRKFMRMITVYLDITAPLYWWKEFDTYKVGTVANSCSTMHKIHEKEFTVNDFSHEHIEELSGDEYNTSYDHLLRTVDILNYYREKYIKARGNYADAVTLKRYWWQLIQLLPSSYNQRRTVMLNYEVLANIYKSRKDHKLDEWRDFCKWIKTLPYAELITGKDD